MAYRKRARGRRNAATQRVNSHAHTWWRRHHSAVLVLDGSRCVYLQVVCAHWPALPKAVSQPHFNSLSNKSDNELNAVSVLNCFFFPKRLTAFFLLHFNVILCISLPPISFVVTGARQKWSKLKKWLFDACVASDYFTISSITNQQKKSHGIYICYNGDSNSIKHNGRLNRKW